MEPVRGHRNKSVVAAARLHRARNRRETGQCLVEGPALLADALSAGGKVIRIFALPDDDASQALADNNDLEIVLVDDRALQRLAGTETPRGPIAVVETQEDGLDPAKNLLVSWGVSDPGNVGNLIRTAASFGWGFAYTRGTADPWAPKTIRAGAGGHFQTRIVSIEGLADLEGWITVATIVGDGEPPAPMASPVAVVIGEEASGLPESVAAGCDHKITIPTTGHTESLNAAAAAAIVVYELSKPPRQPGDEV